MEIDRTEAMLSGPILPLLLKMATPQALGFFVQSSVSIAEIWFIGQLGTTGLAGMALVFPLLMLIQMLSTAAFGGAVTGATARALGSGDTQRAQAILWHVVYLAISLALLLVIIHFIAGEAVLRLLGGEDDVLQQALDYTSILFPGCIVMWLFNMMLCVERGAGNVQLPAMLMILGAIIQVPLSGALILGWGLFPQLGIKGAAISILTVNTINVGILIILHVSGRLTVQFDRRFRSFKGKLIADILSVGALAAVSPFFTVFSILIMTGLVGRFGTEALAGYGIAARVEFLVLPLVFGIGVSMTTLVGLNIGRGNIDRAERIGWIGGIVAGVLCGSAGILLALFPEFWTTIFSKEPKTIAVASDYFRITAPFFGFLGMGLSLYLASQGAKAVGWPVFATMLRFVITIGGGWMIVTRFNGDLKSLFMCVSAAVVVYAGTTCGAIYMGAWRKTEKKPAT